MLLPPLRDQDDGEGADEMREAARGAVAESFAAAGENRAMPSVLRFGAGRVLGYTSRPVGGR
jgi:hypothetical protein